VTYPQQFPAGHLRAVLEQLAGPTTADRGELRNEALATVDDLERRLGEARTSLRTAEEVVVRQKALLETATEMIEEARRWARSLWDDRPAPHKPMVMGEPALAPAWLTAANGPRRAEHRPRTPVGLEPSAVAHALRLAALDRLLADLEEEWGALTAEEMDAAARRLRARDGERS
jgi:hypothetical protein